MWNREAGWGWSQRCLPHWQERSGGLPLDFCQKVIEPACGSRYGGFKLEVVVLRTPFLARAQTHSHVKPHILGIDETVCRPGIGRKSLLPGQKLVAIILPRNENLPIASPSFCGATHRRLDGSDDGWRFLPHMFPSLWGMVSGRRGLHSCRLAHGAAENP